MLGGSVARTLRSRICALWNVAAPCGATTAECRPEGRVDVMRRYSEWTEAEIAGLIGKVPEQAGFEYKRADALREIPARPLAEITAATDTALKQATDERSLLKRLASLQGKAGRSREEVVAEVS